MMLREVALLVIAFALVRIGVIFLFEVLLRQRGSAANDGRRAARRHADRLRHLPDERGRRESGQPHHDVRGVDRRHRVLDAGDAGQSVGRHRAAGRQHVPARRLDTRRRRGGADHRHPLALPGGRDQRRRDGDDAQRAAGQQPRDRAGAARRPARFRGDAPSNSSSATTRRRRRSLPRSRRRSRAPRFRMSPPSRARSARAVRSTTTRSAMPCCTG